MKRIIIQNSLTLLLILLLQHSIAKTITKHETIEEPNGTKITRMHSWSSSDDNENDDFPLMHKNFDSQNNELLKEAAAKKGMDPLAIDELLRTNNTVVRSFTDEQGYKHTTNYLRTPEGGISSRTRIEKTGSIPLDEMLKYGGEVPGIGPIPIEDILRSDKPISKSYVDPNGNTVSTTYGIQKSNDVAEEPTRLPNWPTWSTVKSSPELDKSPTDTAHDIKKDVEVFSPRRTTTWPGTSIFDNPSREPGTSIFDNPAHGPGTSIFDNPSRWPVSPFDVNNKRHEPDVFTKHTTTNDDNGNTVTTKWTTKTYTFPTMPRLIPSTPTTSDTFFTTTTTQRPFAVTSPKSTTVVVPKYNPLAFPALKPTKTFNINDLPVTEILQNGKPVDTDFIQSLPEGLRPLTQNEFTSTKTFKIDNIPMTSTDVGLSLDIQDVLQKAGITPDEINASNGEPIVKTRVEPDGKIVRTTYRVKTIPTITHGADHPFDDFKPNTFPKQHFGDDFNLMNNNDWLPNTNYKPSPTTTTAKPQILDETIELPVSWQLKLVPQLSPTVREQLEKSGLSNEEIQGGYNKPIVKTRLDSNGKLVRTTYNLRDYTRQPSNILDFLHRVDLHPDDILLRSGRGITKTIIDDDGRILTANFRLSAPLNDKHGNDSRGTAEKSTLKPWK